MKVSELAGALLDYWVARAAGLPLSSEWDCCIAGGIFIGLGNDEDPLFAFEPSARWADGGPIIERERIALFPAVGDSNVWMAQPLRLAGSAEFGDTPLIAAMRCYVWSVYGEEVPA